MDRVRLARAYVSELLDRIVRFDMHLSIVEDEFYTKQGFSGDTAAERPLFLTSFKKCVDDLLTIVVMLSEECRAIADDNAATLVMLKAKHGFLVLADLHETGLVHLPRPSEPTELKRFLRMIARHVLTRSKPDLAVYMTETTSESAFPDDPIRTLQESGGVADLIRLMNLPATGTSGSPFGEQNARGIHVTIPRIDARNPLRWPSLIHEAAHKLISADVIGASDIEQKFVSSLPDEVVAAIREVNIDLRSWLTEIWCDLFASLVVGPAFFFSQYSAFISSPSDGILNSGYPPHSLRLFLIANCQRHLYSIARTSSVRDRMASCMDLVDYWDRSFKLHIESNASMKLLADSMRLFFMEHFFGGTASEADNFRRKYDKMVRYVREICPDQLRNIQLSISEGLPVPSKPSRSGVWLAEEPTSIQEVLLAAWLDRLERLLPEGLNIASGQTTEPLNREELLKPFVKFDGAVLRSLQIAEWLHVLIDTTPSTKAATFARDCERACDEQADGEHLINDVGIARLLKSGKLRIVPLVDLEQQLGAASFDIRLGTSFEVYLPAYVRQGSSADASPDAYTARSVDLDFLQHIVLLPGEMVLAHSFEYVRLPAEVAAELDGRSSYARLGLEIHLTAGMIDPGFEGTITFEMVNNGPNPISLFPGLRIGQLRFLSVQRPMRPYSARGSAKYGRQLHHRRSLYTSDVDYQKLRSAMDQQECFAQDAAPRTSASSGLDRRGR